MITNENSLITSSVELIKDIPGAKGENTDIKNNSNMSDASVKFLYEAYNSNVEMCRQTLERTQKLCKMAMENHAKSRLTKDQKSFQKAKELGNLPQGEKQEQPNPSFTPLLDNVKQKTQPESPKIEVEENIQCNSSQPKAKMNMN